MVAPLLSGLSAAFTARSSFAEADRRFGSLAELVAALRLQSARRRPTSLPSWPPDLVASPTLVTPKANAGPDGCDLLRTFASRLEEFARRTVLLSIEGEQRRRTTSARP
jgi:hypothetical protein